MSNLAQNMYQIKDKSGGGAQVIAFPKPSLIQEAIVDTRKNEDGFTPLPNFICDEGYLAVLDGDAVKCLVFLNRYIHGFHLNSKGMSETLIKKITGIKDGRTVQKYMSKLAKYQLIKIQKEKGKSNVYFLTFEDRLPTQHVGTLHAPTQEVPTSDVGGVPTQHAGSSTYMACGSDKEIYLKENIKEKDNKKFTAQNRPLNFVEYHPEDSDFISFKDLCKKYPAQVDFQDQARTNFPNHSVDRIYKNLETMAQWSLDKGKHTPQKWMSIWLTTFMKNLKTDAEEQAFQQRKAKQSQKPKTNLDVNAAWEKAEYQPVSAPVDIPEDFL